jgi:hypothetical protein
MLGLLASGLSIAGLKDADVQLLDQLMHQKTQMVLPQHVLHMGRQQRGLLGMARLLTRHALLMPYLSVPLKYHPGCDTVSLARG